jgi:hypothetical protein
MGVGYCFQPGVEVAPRYRVPSTQYCVPSTEYSSHHPPRLAEPSCASRRNGAFSWNRLLLECPGLAFPMFPPVCGPGVG